MAIIVAAPRSQFYCSTSKTVEFEYYSAIEKNKILPFAATYMDLKGHYAK